MLDKIIRKSLSKFKRFGHKAFISVLFDQICYIIVPLRFNVSYIFIYKKNYYTKFQKKPKTKQSYNTYNRKITQAPKRRGYDPNKPVGSEKTIKQLLGELYGDRQYLEKLLKETGKLAMISILLNKR